MRERKICHPATTVAIFAAMRCDTIRYDTTGRFLNREINAGDSGRVGSGRVVSRRSNFRGYMTLEE